MQKPEVVQQIKRIIGKELVLAPTYPDWITGLMVVKKGKAKYAIEDGQLIGLNLAGMNLKDEQWEEIIDHIDVGALKTLNLSFNDLTTINNIDHFSGLIHLEITNNGQLKKLTFNKSLPVLERLVLSENKLLRFKIVTEFPALRYLDVRGNGMETLDLSGSMPKLKLIDSSKNKIKNIDVKQLDNFTELEYWYANSNLFNNSLTIHHNAREHGKNYLQSFHALKTAFGNDAGILNKEYKVIIVGDGTAGKTCMVNRIVYDKFEKEDSTHGIQIHSYEDEKKKYNFPYKLNIWDFGGQDIYHATHRLFLQKDSVYLLAWNEKTETEQKSSAKSGTSEDDFENKKVDYWMQYIHAYGKESPIVLVQTHKEDSTFQLPHKEKIWSKYGKNSFIDFVEVDSEPDDTEKNGFDGLMDKLKAGIKSLERSEDIPVRYVALKEYLENTRDSNIEKYESKEQFLKAKDATLDYDLFIAKTKELEIEKPEDLLFNWLVPLGIVYYKEGCFDGNIILNQEWAIRAIYKLFERRLDLGGYYYKIKIKKGRITGADLREYWKGYGKKEQDLFIEFMKNCHMCYEVRTKDYHHSVPFKEKVFIIPELLEDDRPEDFNYQAADFLKAGCLRLKYQYDFAYYDYFQRFLVKTQENSDEKPVVYKYGLKIRDDGSYALIEFDKDQSCINIAVSKNGKSLLDRIRNRFKVIHNEKVQTFVGLDNNDMVDLSKLQRIKGQDLEKIPIETVKGDFVPAIQFEPFLNIDEKEKFETQDQEAILPNKKANGIRVYFSYAWRDKDNPDRELLVNKMFTSLNREGFDVHRDKEQSKFGSSLEKFMKEISAGELIFIFLSKKYFKSKFCMQELYGIISRSMDDDDFRSKIIPIQVEKIDYYDEDFREDLDIFWGDAKVKAKKRKKKKRKLGLAMGDKERKRLDRIIAMADESSNIIEIIADINRGNQQLYEEEGLRTIIAEIENRFTTNGALSGTNLGSKIIDSISEINIQLTGLSKGVDLTNAKLDKISSDINEKFENVLLAIDRNTFSEDKIRRLNIELIEQMTSNISSLPKEFIDQWKQIQNESKNIADVKAKLKLDIAIIPGILKYEAEIGKDLPIFKWAKKYWSNFNLNSERK